MAFPAAVLTAVAFSAPLAAFAATQSTDISFGVLIRLVIMPLFLFSGTFFPVSQLPGWLQVVARFSPLWHAAELTRSFTTGRISWDAVLAHTAVLVALTIAGLVWGRRTFTWKLAL
jgi:lipooligosaccharide transport system permease protein